MADVQQPTIPAAFLAEVECQWVTLPLKVNGEPGISRCLWCDRMVKGGPAPCPVKQMREPVNAE
jgi:hypothetical protein